ncbi:type III glutamate--ammonia ligase [Candidatus Pelagibacter ubique]|jgi:glutamine synthetase|uniref:type III glutamate--ammonia ligase n=1 Tax=Pelagibacter ubique TaxID=198252 RepID=UPI0023037DA8|nr:MULTISPECIES: type III glutamate--ammonia ligase [Pelagibacter]MDA9076593.1 type III glutamate--ammonia ligase [bacterium]MDA7450683.1 type III glutamate--ammonia ligase [Candidatus Pelagibacter ubique]MDA7452848.1 type III glutamate--ammonia ligase [Candidatus Pelagibacter ubique]MDA7473535.1 type III glutamate--ammonia ligase [Candidatus Pelagibacter ubique]MDA8836716.1 type III glutamate--ammonia ligase [Candidatus Pelagibacter bacterium]
MAKNLAQIAKQKKIKYFLISFVDLFGILRSKLVPAQAIGEMQKNGAGFAGFATWLDMTPADSDMFGVPDPDSLIQLPWNKEIGWLASDLYMDGRPVKASPRVMLKEQIKKLSKKKLQMKSGVECEYFLISEDGSSIADPRDTQSKPCYDQSALMRRYELIKEICDSMIQMGWKPYQNDHEDANGQFEMNWDYTDALVTADRHVFFKYMVKTLAEKHGLRATFMPKPFHNLTGNGCHAHVSVWNGKDNKFLDKKDKLGLSKLAYNFLGGLIKNAQPLSAFFNPTINSYRRINAPPTKSGATWSPSSISYTGNNRTHMIRIPDKGRFELRLMDGAANPYLLQAGILAAGLEGLDKKINPGKPLFCNMYTDHKKYPKLPKLPNDINQALSMLQKSKSLSDAFGSDVINSYIKLKKIEINDFKTKASFNKKRPVTSWEKNNTLDC